MDRYWKSCIVKGVGAQKVEVSNAWRNYPAR